MSADATTLLTVLLSAKPAKRRMSASASPALQQALLTRMGLLLQKVQGQVKQGKGVNMMVDVDALREFVKNASLLANHLMAVQQANIECKDVSALFAEQASRNQMCNILVTSDKQRKCKAVNDNCVPIAEANAAKLGELEEQLAAVSRVNKSETSDYVKLVQAVLADLDAKTSAGCNSRCAAMVSRFATKVKQTFNLFQQLNIEPAKQVVQRVRGMIAENKVVNLDSTISEVKNVVKLYKAASAEALKTLQQQQAIFNREFAKLARA